MRIIPRCLDSFILWFPPNFVRPKSIEDHWNYNIINVVKVLVARLQKKRRDGPLDMAKNNIIPIPPFPSRNSPKGLCNPNSTTCRTSDFLPDFWITPANKQSVGSNNLQIDSTKLIPPPRQKLHRLG